MWEPLLVLSRRKETVDERNYLLLVHFYNCTAFKWRKYDIIMERAIRIFQMSGTISKFKALVQ
jgi:hypothetical protein